MTNVVIPDTNFTDYWYNNLPYYKLQDLHTKNNYGTCTQS